MNEEAKTTAGKLDPSSLPTIPAGATYFVARPPKDVVYLRIDADGTVTLGPDITWNEAAQALLAELERLSGTKPTSVRADLSKVRSDAIDECISSLESERPSCSNVCEFFDCAVAELRKLKGAQ